MAEIRSTPLPQVRESTQPVQDRPAASRINIGAQVAASQYSGAEMEGLVRGLASFNSNLNEYTNYSIHKERQVNTELAASEAAAAAAKADLTSQPIEEIAGQTPPPNVPVAYGGIFKEALGRLLVDREAVRASQDWVASYNEASKNPDFDPEAFIKEQRARTLGGLTDPDLIGRMGGKVLALENQIRGEAEKRRIQKLEETATSGMLAAVEESIRPDMSPQELGAAMSSLGDAFSGLGRPRKETAAMVLGRLKWLSDKVGGNPALFDVFEQVDPKTKQSFLTLNPELAGAVLAAREHASQLSKRTLQESSMKDRLQTLATFEDRVMSAPESITLADITENMGPGKAFGDANAAASFYHRVKVEQGKRAADAGLAAAVDAGTLGFYDPADQKKALNARYGGGMQQMWAAAASGDTAAATEMAKVLLQAHGSSGASVTLDSVEKLIQAHTSNLPTGEPTAGFKTAAALYQALSGAPAMREKYFKGDVETMMRTYAQATAGATDPDTGNAYQAALRSVSPESKARQEAFAKTEDFKKLVKDAHKEVVGTGWFTSIKNNTDVEVQAGAAIRDYMATTPGATKEGAKEFAKRWVANNYVIDETSGIAIKVPEGKADDLSKEAISAYTKQVSERFRLGDRNDGEWSVMLIPDGNNGTFRTVLARDGHPERTVDTVRIDALRDAQRASKFLSKDEAQLIRNLEDKARAGTLDPAEVEAGWNTVAKAKMLRGISPEAVRTIEQMQLKTVKANLDGIPRLDLGTPDMGGVNLNLKRGTTVDNKLTADIALKLANSPVAAGGSPAAGLAASLIAVGEGVVLKATPDPNPKAGKNIGMGYNLNANAKTVRADLAKAGVSPDRIEGVIEGTYQLTPEQAMRLTMVTIPRYEKLARDVAEKTAPGLWSRMPQHQQAVMIDVAWQTGNPDQFRKAWAAAASGDNEAFQRETKVFYENAKGERVEDTRRGKLRAYMLNGSAQWNTAVQQYGGYPSKPMDLAALNQK